MSELLLQTIVEKLNALSIVLLKQDNTGDVATQQSLIKEIKSFQSETKLIKENLKLNNDKISELTDSFNNYTFKKDNRLRIILSTGMFCTKEYT